MSPGAGGGGQDSLALTLARLKAKGEENLNKVQRDLLKWHSNVDKGYAWIVILALFVMMTATLGPYRIYGLIYAKVTTEGVYTREEASWPVSTIFTVENVAGPFVSIIIYHISYRKSLFIGGLLLAIGNGLSAFSTSIIFDVLLLGVVQGIGYSFIFMPFMEIINSYFLKFRNIALGFALCGGTLSIFWWQPLIRWILNTYPWRYAYLGLGAICCLNVMMVPLLRPNPMPDLVQVLSSKLSKPSLGTDRRSSTKNISLRALQYRNSIRQQSTIMINKPENPLQRQASIISINPFASTTGLERKISQAIASTRTGAMDGDKPNPDRPKVPIQKKTSAKSIVENKPDFSNDACSIDEIEHESDFEWKIIFNVLKTPGFHLIWYNELLYYWVFSIYCLVMVDYGIDRGCTVEQAQSLLNYQSMGELVGRLLLTILVDMRFLSNKNWVILVLMIMGSLLIVVTQITGFIWMATITTSLSAISALLYILLNGLLVEFLGEKQVTIGYGMASCIAGLLMSFRPQAVGYFRDQHGTYDPLMMVLAMSCAIGAVICVLEPLVTRCVGSPCKPENNTQVDSNS